MPLAKPYLHEQVTRWHKMCELADQAGVTHTFRKGVQQ
jgi:hypothetical protein